MVTDEETGGTSIDAGRMAEGVDGTYSSNRILVKGGGSRGRGDPWASTGSLSEEGEDTGGKAGDDMRIGRVGVDRVVKAGETGEVERESS